MINKLPIKRDSAVSAVFLLWVSLWLYQSCLLVCGDVAVAEQQFCYSSLASRLSGLGDGLFGAHWQFTMLCCRHKPGWSERLHLQYAQHTSYLFCNCWLIWKLQAISLTIWKVYNIPSHLKYCPFPARHLKIFASSLSWLRFLCPFPSMLQLKSGALNIGRIWTRRRMGPDHSMIL